ncbi:helix-turn-helix domain-containing protein [Sphingobium herbicidovorans]
MTLTEFVDPTEIGSWIPAATLASSRPGQWCGLGLSILSHRPWEGEVPPWRDYLFTAFTRPGAVARSLGGAWQSEMFEDGDVTLLPRGRASHWQWGDSLQNIHLYVAEHYLAGIAQDVFGRDESSLELVDRLRISDPAISSAIRLLAGEVEAGGYGEQLFVDSVGTQICIHILRKYCFLGQEIRLPNGGLDRADAKRVADYIEAGLSSPLSIRELASVARMSPFHFARKFKEQFGLSPHRYVMARRLELARRLMMAYDLSIKQIASRCGFYDQSHLTRLYRARYGITPRLSQVEQDVEAEV